MTAPQAGIAAALGRISQPVTVAGMLSAQNLITELARMEARKAADTIAEHKFHMEAEQ